MKEEPREEGPRSFARFIEQVADGVVHSELSTELHKLTSTLQDEAVNRHAKAKGSLTLKMSFEVMPNGVVTIRYDLDTKTPKPARNEGVAWLTPKGGNVVFENPKQTKLPLREVGGTPEPARDVPAAATAAREV